MESAMAREGGQEPNRSEQVEGKVFRRRSAKHRRSQTVVVVSEKEQAKSRLFDTMLHVNILLLMPDVILLECVRMTPGFFIQLVELISLFRSDNFPSFGCSTSTSMLLLTRRMRIQ